MKKIYIILFAILLINFRAYSQISELKYNLCVDSISSNFSETPASDNKNNESEEALKNDSIIVAVRYNIGKQKSLKSVISDYSLVINNFGNELIDGYIIPIYDYLFALSDIGHFTDYTLENYYWEELKFSRPYKKYSNYPTLIFGGIGLGCDFGMQNLSKNNKPWQSIEIDWLYLVGLHIARGYNSGYFGVGLNWKNYRLSDSEYFDIQNGTLIVSQAGEAKYVDYSNFHMFSIQFPILWERRFKLWMLGSPLSMSIGPILTITPTANFKSKLCQNNNSKEVIQLSNTIKNQRICNVDVMYSLKLCKLGSLYMRYSLWGAFKDNPHFQFNPFSAGFIFGL